MTFTHEIDKPYKDSLLLHLAGEFGGIDALQLKDKVLKIIEAAPVNKFVIEISGVTYIDSGAIRFLFEFLEKAQEKKMKLFLANPSDAVRRILEIAAVHKVIDIL